MNGLSLIFYIPHGTEFILLGDCPHIRNACAIWVPRYLTPEQMKVEICQEHHLQVVEQGGAYLKSRIISDQR